MTTPSNVELIAEYTAHLRAERGMLPNTVAAYLSDLWQFCEMLDRDSDAVLFNATKDDVARFLQHLARHDILERSRARKGVALRRFYRWLIVNERIDKDPTRLLVQPRMPKLLPKPVAADTLRDIIDAAGKRAAAADATCFEVRDCAMLEMLYGAGIRVSELCGAQLGGVDLRAGTVLVRGKGGKERIVPLGRGAVAAIENYVRFARPQLVRSGKGIQRALFLSDLGTRIGRRQVHRRIATLGGEEHLYPHRLRHSCATHMLDSGEADLRQVQEQLGHANLGTTQIYTQVSNEALQKAHARSHPRG